MTSSEDCGFSDVDSNRNGAADCIDPSTTLTPTVPVVTTSGRTATIAMQEFPGRVRYRILLKSPQGRKEVLSETSSALLRRLAKGNYEVRYAVEVQGEGGYSKSQVSPRVRFRIENRTAP